MAASSFAGQHKQAGDENGLGHLAFLVRRGLERLARRVGKTIQVQAIVPVGAADERQAVRAEAFERVIETAAQVLVERLFGAGFVFELHRFVEDAPVAGFLEVGGDAEDEPVRIVVEAAADVVVAAFGERLILVERAAALSCVAAMSRMRSRARAGTMWTKPSRSWLESRKPRPRPMPDS